jgi:hypothetical protein
MWLLFLNYFIAINDIILQLLLQHFNSITVRWVCCIPAWSRWRTYHGYCSQVRAEIELWLRPGGEGLLVQTITCCTKCMEFIINQ